MKKSSLTTLAFLRSALKSALSRTILLAILIVAFQTGVIDQALVELFAPVIVEGL